MTIFWGDLNLVLPVGNDQADKARRDALFNELDLIGNGIVRQVDFKRCMFRRMPAVKGIDDMATLVNQAFVGGRKTIEPVVMLGDNQVDRNQFRGVLLYLRCYLKLWDVFQQHGVAPGDAFAARDLAIVTQVLCSWGVPDVRVWEESPEEVFRQIDLRGSGCATFSQLADFAVRYALPQLMDSDEGMEEEKSRAKQLINKWLPHVAERAPVSVKPGWNGIAPPLAPMGQKRPPKAILGQRAEVEARRERAGSPNSRWKTQYQYDFPAQAPVRRSSSVGALLGADEEPSRQAEYKFRTTTKWPMARGEGEVPLATKNRMGTGIPGMPAISQTSRNPATLARMGGYVLSPKAAGA